MTSHKVSIMTNIEFHTLATHANMLQPCTDVTKISVRVVCGIVVLWFYGLIVPTRWSALIISRKNARHKSTCGERTVDGDVVQMKRTT